MTADQSRVLEVDDELRLRPLTVDDGPALIAAVRAAHDHLWPWMVWAHPDYGPDDLDGFLAMVERGLEEPYLIEAGAGTDLLGLCSLNRLDPTNRTGNLGFWLRPEATGRGAATRASARLLIHALDDRDLERVEVLAAVANGASIRVAERLDLHEEGIRARALRIDGEQQDLRVFAAFRGDVPRLRRGLSAGGR